MSAVAALYSDPELVARFWSYVDKSGPVPAHRPELGSCWMWTGSKNWKGYGQFSAGETTVSGRSRSSRAHRVSWVMHHGDVGDLWVLHACDTPACVRPDHLFIGTATDNYRDMERKGRAMRRQFTSDDYAKSAANCSRGDGHYSRLRPDLMPRGESHGCARMTVEAVRDIRARRAAGESREEIGARYGIHAASVSAIALRRTWRHVP